MVYIPNRIGKIKVGAKALGLDDKTDRDDYEALLFGATGKTSCSDMTQREQDAVIRTMTKMGAFKTKPLTAQQNACVAKWYKLRCLGEVSSKDKSSLNRYCKNHLGKWNVCDLTPNETNVLLGMLEGWIRKVEHAVRKPGQPVIEEG